jgi:hypothetical protein
LTCALDCRPFGSQHLRRLLPSDRIASAILCFIQLANRWQQVFYLSALHLPTQYPPLQTEGRSRVQHRRVLRVVSIDEVGDLPAAGASGRVPGHCGAEQLLSLGIEKRRGKDVPFDLVRRLKRTQ